MTETEAVQAWLANYKPGTRYTYGNLLRLLSVAKGPLLSLTVLDLTAYLNQIANEVSYQTWHVRKAALESFYEFCFRAEILEKNPAAELFAKYTRQKEPTRRYRALDYDRVRATIANIKNPRHKAIIGILFATGCRRSELAALRVCDYEVREGVGVLTFHKTKNSKTRSVGLPPSVKEYLDAAMPKQMYPEASIFGITPEQICRLTHQYLNCSPHEARTSLVTKLLAEHVPPADIMPITGHGSMQMVLHYRRDTTPPERQLTTKIEL